MDRNEYLKKCKVLSIHQGDGAWWRRQWNESDLVSFDGINYVPFAYRMDFMKGEVLNVAVLHDLQSNTEVYCDLEKVKEKI